MSVGLITMEKFGIYSSANTIHQQVVVGVVLVFLFFVPILLFVIGQKYLVTGFLYRRKGEFLQELPGVVHRMIYWFLGSALFGVVYAFTLYVLF